MKKIFVGIFILVLASTGILIFVSKVNTATVNQLENKTNDMPKLSYKVTTDSTGMSSVANATYSGTTKVEIYSGNKLILSLSGADGVGSNPLCGSVAKFNDTPASYTLLIKDAALDLGHTVAVSDYSSTDYKELTLFGRRSRIVDNTIYFDKMLNDNPSTFNPECGFRATFVTFPKIKFNVTGKNNYTGTENLYKVETHFDLLDADQKQRFIDYVNQLNF